MCGSRFSRFEEKETDVAIGVELMDLVARQACESVVLVTGDSGLVPAIKTAKALSPGATIVVGLPYLRATAELKRVADLSFTMRPASYARHQLPDTVRAPDGKVIRRLD